MSFLNPWLLCGAGAIAAPILLHLMAPRARAMAWAAMRFVQAATQKNRRRLRLEERLLLLLRCLLLVLLALALARPALHVAGIAGAGPLLAVLAIDNSGSMGLSNGGASRLDHAREAAQQIVDQLPAGSSVALLAFSDVARPLIPEPTPDLLLARRMIRDIPQTDRGSEAWPAIRQALEIFSRHATDRKQLYVITDGQAAAWKQLDAIRAGITSANAHPQLVLVGPEEEPDLGVSGLSPSSASAAVGQPIRFAVEVTNYGTHDAANVPVSLALDHEPPCDQGIIASIPPGETRAISLFAKFRAGGWHSATARLTPDHLAMNDERSCVIRAFDEVRVLLVAGEPSATPRESDVFFLQHALAPAGDADFVKPRVISAGELPGARLDDFAAIFLADVRNLATPEVKALQAYLRRGGGLMIFPGPATDAGFYNRVLAGDAKILPATLAPPLGDAEKRTRFLTLQAGGYTHPVVSIWQDPAAGVLTGAHFFRAFPLRLLPGPVAPRVILNFSDGAPAMAEQDYGLGRVILFASTATTEWNDLPVHPAFVPLMQRALSRLISRGGERLNIPVGAPFVFTAKADSVGREVVIQAPGAGPDKAARRQVALINGEAVLRFEETDRAGVYEVELPGQPPISFAAQPDPAESSQAMLPEADLEAVARGAAVLHWDGRADSRLALRRAASGRELWAAFAMLALAVAGVETVLAGKFSVSK